MASYSSSPLTEILSVYSPRRVKKFHFSPGGVSTFWRLVSLILAFVCGVLFWQCVASYTYKSIPPVTNCQSKPEIRSIKKVDNQEDEINSFKIIPKSMDQFHAKGSTATKKLIVLYGRNIWSKFDTWSSTDWNNKCSRQDCSISLDASAASRSSAVVFNALQMPSQRHLNLFQKARRQSDTQSKFVFLSGVTPTKTKFDAEDYDLFFDLTITYKKDSDVRIPYWPNDLILPSMFRQSPVNSTSVAQYNENLDDFFVKQGKKKFMLCIVKSCTKSVWSGGFVRKMREEGVIDIYTLDKCDDDDDKKLKEAKQLPCSELFSDECVKFVEQYRFVTIALDEYCDGYIPREYWYAISAWQAVPVLWGCQSDALIKNTFINALDEEYISPTFKKARSASDDPKNYLKYSLEKNQGQVDKFYWQCELCKILHGERKSARTLLSFAEFWDKDRDCGKNSKSYKLAKGQLVRTGVISGD